MQTPWFWQSPSLSAHMVSTALSPLGFVYNLAQNIHWQFQSEQRIATPVLCIGGLTLGGVGKTPIAIAIAQMLAAHNVTPHLATRGYGGHLNGPTMVDPKIHSYKDVGDEALLLSRHYDTFIGRDRGATLSYAERNGAALIIMDDGFQNHRVAKTLSFLLLDAARPFGNGYVFPAGPLREPPSQAIARADAIILVRRSPDQNDPPGSRPATPPLIHDKPIFDAVFSLEEAQLPGKAVAFCGLGNPTQFFAMLEQAGTRLAKTIAFPDHHPFSERELAQVIAMADKNHLPLLTTHKDYIRIPEELRNKTTPVGLECTFPEKDTLIEFIQSRLPLEGKNAS